MFGDYAAREAGLRKSSQNKRACTGPSFLKLSATKNSTILAVEKLAQALGVPAGDLLN
jgi:hypothetical protein